MTSRQVRRHLADLELLGLVRVGRSRRAPGGFWRSNMCRVGYLGLRVLARGPGAICGRRGRVGKKATVLRESTIGHYRPHRRVEDDKEKQEAISHGKIGPDRAAGAGTASLDRAKTRPPREFYAILEELTGKGQQWRRRGIG